MTLNVKPFYECPHCFKKLTTESRLLKHSCEAKKRSEYLKTQKGKSAYYCYKTWMNLRGYKVGDMESFSESRYYNSIVNFVAFCNKVGIPDRRHFITRMIELDLSPTQWNNPDVYKDYMIYFDNSKTPLELVSISTTTILDLSEIFECEIKEIFEHMTSADIMRLVVARKLSPWLLLFSKSFMNHLKLDTTSEQRMLINTVIDPRQWVQKFNNDPESVKSIKKIIAELKI